MAQVADEGPIVLFDGVCNLCNASVRFLVRRDRRGRLRYAALQSETARRLMEDNGLVAGSLETMVLIEAGAGYTESTAALLIARHLPAPWSWLAFLRIVPRPVRDAVYRLVARNRYRWFGRQDACMVPTAELAKRFLD